MEKYIKTKLDEKVRAYLKKNFPNCNFLQAKLKENDPQTEVYGLNGMKILVVQQSATVFYQLITNSAK